MQTMQVELPDQLAREVESAVQSGRFENAGELVRVAQRDFLSNRRFELLEQQQLQDVALALREQAPPT
jgi:Arc/MetJ-type ribon-helix-helix transcriptional regulator